MLKINFSKYVSHLLRLKSRCISVSWRWVHLSSLFTRFMTMIINSLCLNTLFHWEFCIYDLYLTFVLTEDFLWLQEKGFVYSVILFPLLFWWNLFPLLFPSWIWFPSSIREGEPYHSSRSLSNCINSSKIERNWSRV